MATLADFLRDLFEDGRIVHRAFPGDPGEDRPAALEILGRAHRDHRLDVAGPAIPLDGPAALEAADFLRRASWFLVNRSAPAEAMERGLPIPAAPRSAAGHLSADLTLRFLPQLHRRARAASAGDPLAGILAGALRRHPLSGVLADLDEGPADLGDLGGHPGLQILYAERLALRERPGWMPADGPFRDAVGRVFRGLGRGNSPLLRPAPDSATAGGVAVG